MFRRGFKTWCERLAGEYRKDLRLKSIDPLSPWTLATHMGVSVWTPEQITRLDQAVLHRLTTKVAGVWSAVTLCCDSKDLIILNSAHSRARQSNDLMHELSHILIGHTAARVDVTEDNLLMLNSYDKTQENEADWLAGTILLPREALMYIVRRRMTLQTVADTYGVSKDLVTWRTNVTGVKRQLQRVKQRSRK